MKKFYAECSDVPAEDTPEMRALSFLGKSFVTYLAKHRDGTGKIHVHGDNSVSAARIIHYVGGNLHDSAVADRLLREAVEYGALAVEKNAIKIVGFDDCDGHRKGATRRMFVRDSGTFVMLSLTARMIAARCIQSCDDDGSFHGVTDTSTMASRFLRSEFGREKERDRRVVHSALDQLFSHGFLVRSGDSVTVEGFAAMQAAIVFGERDVWRREWESVRARLAPIVFGRDNHACVYCGANEALTIDHIVPRLQGGAHDPSNLTTACRPCNSAKNDRTPEEWVNRPARCVAYAASKAITMEPAAC